MTQEQTLLPAEAAEELSPLSPAPGSGGDVDGTDGTELSLDLSAPPEEPELTIEEAPAEEEAGESAELPEGPGESPPQTYDSGRDLRAEVISLFAAFPELDAGEISDELIRRSLSEGIPLAAAYGASLAARRGEELEKLRRENETLRLNARAMEMAPVRGRERRGQRGL